MHNTWTYVVSKTQKNENEVCTYLLVGITAIPAKARHAVAVAAQSIAASFDCHLAVSTAKWQSSDAATNTMHLKK